MPIRESLFDNVQDVYLEVRNSKSGSPYKMLVVEFTDGYKFMKPAFGDTEYILSKQLNPQQ